MTVATSICSSAILLTIPILWAALGETINEVAGVINVGIEGTMLVGAFTAAVGVTETGSLGAGFAAGLGAGIVTGALLAYAYVTRGADQIVTGILFNLLALGLTTVLYSKYLGDATSTSTLRSLQIPLLHRIPVVGPSLFSQTALGYAAIVMGPAVWYLLRRTWFGLHVRALGQRPQAGDAAGLDVQRLRWIAMIAGATLASAGGASIVLTVSGDFIPNITAGQGFIAVAVVMLCRWNPMLVLFGSLMFGLASSLQFQLQVIPSLSSIPTQLLLAIPYIASIVAIAFAKSTRFPRAAGIPYRAGRAAH